MSLKQHDLIGYQDHVEETVEIHPNNKTKHGHTCNGQITYLGLCSIENPNPNRLKPLGSLF